MIDNGRNLNFFVLKQLREPKKQTSLPIKEDRKSLKKYYKYDHGTRCFKPNRYI